MKKQILTQVLAIALMTTVVSSALAQETTPKKLDARSAVDILTTQQPAKTLERRLGKIGQSDVPDNMLSLLSALRASTGSIPSLKQSTYPVPSFQHVAQVDGDFYCQKGCIIEVNSIASELELFQKNDIQYYAVSSNSSSIKAEVMMPNSTRWETLTEMTDLGQGGVYNLATSQASTAILIVGIQK